VYTALIPAVVVPYDVVVCNRELGPLPDFDGGPDLRAVPNDATMLLVFHRPLPVGADVSQQLPLNGATMQFAGLGGGNMNWAGFRQFTGAWWATAADGSLHSLLLWLYVGQNAGPEWAEVQPIVQSIHIPA
jgi:hypothetical protein